MSAEVRNRKTQVENRMKDGMVRLESVMGDSMLKFKLMPSRVKILFGLSAVISLCLYLYLGTWLFSSDDEKSLEVLLETEKCPACFGGSACGLFYYKQIQLSGMSKYRLLDKLNAKNVHFAQLAHSTKLLALKKMGTDSELREIDRKICKDANRPEGCDVARVIPITNTAFPLNKKPLTPTILKNTESFMFYCPSYRLLDRIWTYFKEYKKKSDIFMADKVQVLFSAMVNPEPLILQTFPKSEGWPFPEYMGSCGRVVLEENAGTTLGNFYHSSFNIRAALAYELMMIADKLTTKSDFVLYLTDVSYDNFAVDESGQITVIDLEHVIVVDKLAVKGREPAGWNVPHESTFNDCEGENCLLFSRDELCDHEVSDHNYHAICRNILSHYAREPNMEEGFLHDMPPAAEDYWDLGTLLDECAKPSQNGGRWRVKDKLIRALAALKDGSKEHLETVEDRKAKGRKGHNS